MRCPGLNVERQITDHGSKVLRKMLFCHRLAHVTKAGSATVRAAPRTHQRLKAFAEALRFHAAPYTFAHSTTDESFLVPSPGCPALGRPGQVLEILVSHRTRDATVFCKRG